MDLTIGPKALICANLLYIITIDTLKQPPISVCYFHLSFFSLTPSGIDLTTGARQNRPHIGIRQNRQPRIPPKTANSIRRTVVEPTEKRAKYI